MKSPFNRLTHSALFAAALLVSSSTLAPAQQVETVTTTTSQGIINEFGPQSIVIRTDAAPQPLRYTFRDTTTYVDEYGNPVSTSVVKSGLPVTVYYTRDGDALIASKVVVKNVSTSGTSAAVTQTTTASGVINTYGPEGLVVQTQSSGEPMRYSFSETTTYVDENGQPVSIETVKSGLPVTVYYTRDGNNMIASKVIVRSAPVAPAPVTEKKTTTTTTRTIEKDD